MKRPTQEQRILDIMEDDNIMSAAVAAHKLNIYSTFSNCMTRLRREYVIHRGWGYARNGTPYRTYWT